MDGCYDWYGWYGCETERIVEGKLFEEMRNQKTFGAEYVYVDRLL
jgi:hypothetical protein